MKNFTFKLENDGIFFCQAASFEDALKLFETSQLFNPRDIVEIVERG